MNQQYNEKLVGNSRKLRKAMTKEERHLWYDCLKQLPVTVHRQKVLGQYIVDFYIASRKIVIELDGSQHYEQVHQKKRYSAGSISDRYWLQGIALFQCRH